MTALLVIATIVLAVLVDVLLVARRRRRSPDAPPAPRPMREPRPPYNLFLSPGHAWVRLQGDGTLRVGLDDWLVEALGAIDEIAAPPTGTRVRRGEPLLTLRVGPRRLVVSAPADGEVVALNQDVLTSPRTAVSDPYGLGWTVALWARDHKEAIRPLHLGSGAVAFLREEVQRLADFLTTATSPAPAPILADGGQPLRGAVAHLGDVGWKSFERQFLGGQQEK